MCNSLDGTLFYSNMTVPLCIRQGSKRNDDSVSVEELDWSAESQVLIPAEHLWCDTPNSFDVNEMIVSHMYKSLVFGDEFLAQGLHLKSHQRCSAGISSWLSADQSSSSTLTVS